MASEASAAAYRPLDVDLAKVLPPRFALQYGCLVVRDRIGSFFHPTNFSPLKHWEGFVKRRDGFFFGFNALGCVWIFGWWVFFFGGGGMGWDGSWNAFMLFFAIKRLGVTAWGGGDDDKSQKDLWSFEGGSEVRPHILQVTSTKSKNKHADPSKKRMHIKIVYIYIYKTHHLTKDCYSDFCPSHHIWLSFTIWILISCVFSPWNPRQWADLWPWTLTANAWPKRTKRTWGKKGRDTLITSLWPVCAIEEVVF